tara:strand:+ start:542 stop:2266 length:1725 start_codon:yes stop_codon:yes gene_type:complete
MSWKKHFSIYRKKNNSTGSNSAEASRHTRFNNWLPEVYSGQPNRIERYAQYDQMDADSEINQALDTISEFSTQFKDNNNVPFEFDFVDAASEAEIDVLKSTLDQWCNLNEFDTKIFQIFRNCIKYGEQFFIRDPETFILYWTDPSSVSKAIVNDAKGKEVEQYIVKNLAPNLCEKVATEVVAHNNQYSTLGDLRTGGVVQQTQYGATGSQSSGYGTESEFGVDSKHMVHLSFTEGMDNNWPFGNSLLDPVYKTYIQKQLLEDSIIIYRVQRAPERRVFYIDTGNMPAHKAMSFVERVKNEIHQKRIPTRSGGGSSVLDASYNPLSIMEDYFFAQTAEGRGSKVEVLPGGDNLGEIDDLKYFNNKMMRALRVPSTYISTGPEDSSAVYSDGRVGTAFISEHRFTKYCMRLQNSLGRYFDKEYKMYLKWKGINIDTSIFDLRFAEPQNFSAYREVELNSSLANVFGSLSEVPYISRRFALKKYLQLSEDEIVENEKMWQEEQQQDMAKQDQDDVNLGNVGGRPLDPEGLDLEGAGDEPEGTDQGTADAAPDASPISGNISPVAPTPPTPIGGQADA